MKKFFEHEPIIFSTGNGTPASPHDTIANFRRAVDLGSDVIRTNISRTKDGKIVCHSDEVFTIDAIRKGGIASYGMTELRTICRTTAAGGKAAENQGDLFPELADVLESFPGQRFNLFFFEKSHELMKAATAVVAGMNAGWRILAAARSGNNTKNIVSALPDAAAAMSMAAMIGVYALFRAGLLYFKRRFAADALIIPVRIGASYIANDALIHEVRGKGMRVYIMNVNTPEEARAFRLAGADGFITNDIASIRKALA